MSSAQVRIELAMPAEIAEIVDRLGPGTTVVGGAVRDRMLGVRRIVDWDLATAVGPRRLDALFPERWAFDARLGSLSLQVAGLEVSVTTYRVEAGYRDRRHPDQVTFVADPELDAPRRDFTINALYCEPAGRVLDPTGGVADLQQRVLRAIGDPAIRLGEDPLRVMRGVRLAARFDLRIEAATFAAMRGLGNEVGRIAAGRRFDELDRALSEAGGTALRRLDDLGLLGAVDPALGSGPVEALATAVDRARRAGADPCAALLEAVEDPDGLARRLTIPRTRRPRAADAAPPVISGRDVLALGIAPGPRVGEILAEVRARLPAGAGRAEALAVLREIVGSE